MLEFVSHVTTWVECDSAVPITYSGVPTSTSNGTANTDGGLAPGQAQGTRLTTPEQNVTAVTMSQLSERKGTEGAGSGAH